MRPSFPSGRGGRYSFNNPISSKIKQAYQFEAISVRKYYGHDDYRSNELRAGKPLE